MILDRMIGNELLERQFDGDDVAEMEKGERGRADGIIATEKGEKGDVDAAGDMTPTSIRGNGASQEEEEESFEVRLERLGRERPACFKNTWQEAGFVFSIAMSQGLAEYFVSGFTVMLPTIAKELAIPDDESIWPAAAFSLAVAAFLLVFGRLGDMYGGYPVYVAGMAWLTVWSLVCGFSTNMVMMNVCRAMQGLGPSAFLPASVMLMGSIYRPGPRKNMVFSIYGAMAPLGFFAGIFFAGITGQYTRWGWFFWIGAVLTLITTVTSYLYIPSDIAERKALGIKMDYLGALFLCSGITIFTFAIIDSAHATWRDSVIIALFILGALLLGAAFYVEGWVASDPLLPASLFKVKYMTPLCTALFFTYGGFGIYLFYATWYMQSIMGASPLQVVAWYTPMALGGILISSIGGVVLHLLSSTLLIYIAGIAWVIAPLLFAIAPEGANYWAYVFPAMCCATIGIDLTFNIANIFMTSALPKAQQGVAGALIMLLLHFGIAVCLGFADIVNIETKPSLGLRKSYQAALWFEVACAATALAILVVFVRVKNAESALTADEVREMEEEAEVERVGGSVERVVTHRSAVLRRLSTARSSLRIPK